MYKQNESKRLYKLRVRGGLRAAVLAYLSAHPCIDCGEADPIVLEFDHVRGIKSFPIAKAINDVKGLAVIMKEIEKCDVRCANCHRRKTSKQLNFWKQLG